MALTAEQNALLLRAEMDKQEVTDPQLRAGIAAIAMGESGFQMKPELGYGHTANQRIRTIFGSRLNSFSEDQLNALKVNDEAFFNVVYGGRFGLKQLGNTEPGDGYKFRGRSDFELTGRWNYTKYGTMIGRDLITDPEVADDPEVACAITVAYMRDRYQGGGWAGMKSAVGFNTSDIAATKDEFFQKYLDSGEFGPLHPGEIAPIGPPPPQPAPVHPILGKPSPILPPLRSAVDRIKAIQAILTEGGLYKGAIDGVFGDGSDSAINTLMDQAAAGR